tara:strand:- start:286 stop:609 length:324 start_codon:yes stop_codon:yes gene_type:complete
MAKNNTVFVKEAENLEKGINVMGIIEEKKQPRRVNTKFGEKAVCDAMVRDQSGTIKISLWEDQVEAVSNGDFVRVEGAYTNEYNGVKSLNLGKFGKIEKVDINAVVE